MIHDTALNRLLVAWKIFPHEFPDHLSRLKILQIRRRILWREFWPESTLLDELSMESWFSSTWVRSSKSHFILGKLLLRWCLLFKTINKNPIKYKILKSHSFYVKTHLICSSHKFPLILKPSLLMTFWLSCLI